MYGSYDALSSDKKNPKFQEIFTILNHLHWKKEENIGKFANQIPRIASFDAEQKL